MQKYYPIPLHMHSIWERNASMEGHFYNAQKLGIEHMYITDHDVRMGPRKNQIDNFDFSLGVLRVEESSSDPIRPKWYGFTPTVQDTGTTIRVCDDALQMEAISDSGEWTTVSAVFDTTQKRHEYALLANVFLHLGMQVSPQDADMRVTVDVKLSQRPPEFLHGHLVYVFGNTEGISNPYTVVKPMENPDEFVRYSLSLLKDAETVGGGDNVLNTITFTVAARNGKSARLFVNHLSVSWDIAFEEGRRAQQRLADKIGKKYGVTPYVTTEITGAGPHKISFSTKVPIMDYTAHEYEISDEEAMAHVRKNGGIYSRNHPFDAIKDRVYLGDSVEALEALKKDLITNYIKNRAWGATMLEIGYPDGHEGFSLEDHLRLWDALSSAGIFISGYGDSDNHTNDKNWFEGSNFVAYIQADVPNEETFISGMRAGNLYTGDPVYLQKMTVSYVSTKGQTMGQVSTFKNPGEAVFSIDGTDDDCHVVWNVNGQDIKREKCGRNFCSRMEIPTAEKVNFVRVAVYKGKRCILLTNPLYQTTDEEIVQTVPKERIFELRRDEE